MKIGIYNPYFDTYGGGERYMLTLAEHWSNKHTVSLFWNDSSIIRESENRFHLNLSNVHMSSNIFASSSIVRRIIESMKYDLIVFLSDGSFPMTFAKKNILHFQVPFRKLFLSPWKSIHFQQIICNSEFTKTHLDTSISIPKSVIYPPVSFEDFSSGKKERLILSVGRFNAHYRAKKQEVLIKAFQQGAKEGFLSGWRLVLAGGMLPTDSSYVEDLRTLIGKSSITLLPNASFNEIQSLYASASIYWHAAGYKETNPEHMEHFGISTVEAMAAGCVPVVYEGGGQTEIISDGVNGFTWKTVDEFLKKTIKAMKPSSQMKSKIQKEPERFSTSSFCNKWDAVMQML